jgi:diacylglycerol O-acyltransferase / wax synthase
VNINDLLLTAVSGGMRELLLAHGDRVDGVVLHVGVPVGTPGTGTAGTAGNPGGTMPIGAELPVGPADPLLRLRAVAADMAAKKADIDRSRPGLLQSPLMPSWLVRVLIRIGRTHGSRLVNLYVTNVPGPDQPLWLGGHPLRRPVPIAPLIAQQRVCIAALSYDGELAISVHTDADLAHTDRLVHGIDATFAALHDAARGTAPRRGTGARVAVPSTGSSTANRTRATVDV